MVVVLRSARTGMWSLANDTPYGAQRNWIRDKDGRHHWVVAVQATFDLSERGDVEPADEQPPPPLEPEYWGEPGASSLRRDSEVLYRKPTTDVLVEGSAHAPRSRPTSSMDVSFVVGPVQKQLVVFGNRVYHDALGSGGTTSPQPFSTQPIRYESAFGGADLSHPDPTKQRYDDRNPVGRGVAIHPRTLVDQPAHTIEYPGRSVTRAGPAGFGPIDPSWTPRRQLAGTYDAAWVRSRKPLLPVDYDPLFGCSAPTDQRPPTPLRGGEPVELRGLTPSGLLRFRLPKIYLAYSTYFGRRRQEHRGHLCTVLLRPDDMVLVMVWQTTLEVAPRDSDYLDETRIIEKPYVNV